MYSVEYDGLSSLVALQKYLLTMINLSICTNGTTVTYFLPGQLSEVPWTQTNYKMFPW